MEKEKLLKIVKARISRIKDYRYPEPKLNMPNAIWFQKQDNLSACVTLISNKYHYDIFNKNTGKKLEQGYKDTLPLAKKEVFKYFEDNKSTNSY